MLARGYAVEPLPPERIEQCYPVAALDWPGLALEDWRRFCRKRIEERTGGSSPSDILVAVDRGGYVRALCVYARQGEPPVKPRLQVLQLVIAHLTDAASIAAFILERLQAIAGEQDCESISLPSASAAEWPEVLDRPYPIPITCGPD